jgi:hypothetical protein
MIVLLLAIVVNQLPIQPPIIFNEDSKADVATVAYLGELERFHDRVKRLQREIEREPDEQPLEVLQKRLREYQRDVVPLLDVIRRSVERLRAKEHGAGEFVTRGSTLALLLVAAIGQVEDVAELRERYERAGDVYNDELAAFNRSNLK